MNNSIDFVAHHDIQAQAAQSIFDDLSADFDCRWRIGADSTPSGAAAALLIDHAPFQPRCRKSLRGYRMLFHILHDLADFEVYEAEHARLATCDLLLVPGPLHRGRAERALGRNAPIHEIGWPKYDTMTIPLRHATFEQKLATLPHDMTVLYTPTRGFTYEWRYLLPLLRELPCNTILKNHIYVNPGQPMPAGCEEEYVLSMRSADEMERAIEGYGAPHMLVAPRTLNVCALFPHADVVIADQSSVAAEFLPFGLGIETGRYNQIEDACAPEISKFFQDVVYLPRPALDQTFASPTAFRAFIDAHAPHARAGFQRGAGARGAAVIRAAMTRRVNASILTRGASALLRGREDLRSSRVYARARGLGRRVRSRVGL